MHDRDQALLSALGKLDPAESDALQEHVKAQRAQGRRQAIGYPISLFAGFATVGVAFHVMLLILDVGPDVLFGALASAFLASLVPGAVCFFAGIYATEVSDV